MQRAPDLGFAVQQRPEGGEDAAIIGEDSRMQIDDAKPRDFDDRRLEDLAEADRDDRIGIECAHIIEAGGAVDVVELYDVPAPACLRQSVEGLELALARPRIQKRVEAVF